jgi:hypothetical protein
MLFQNLQTERVNLHLPFALHPGSFEAQIKTTDPREQGAKG